MGEEEPWTWECALRWTAERKREAAERGETPWTWEQLQKWMVDRKRERRIREEKLESRREEQKKNDNGSGRNNDSRGEGKGRDETLLKIQREVKAIQQRLLESMQRDRKREERRLEGSQTGEGESTKKITENPEMLMIGVESEPSSELTLEKSSEEGPSQSMMSIEEEEKRNGPKVFYEGKSPQKMIDMKDDQEEIEENILTVMRRGERTKNRVDTSGVEGNGRRNNSQTMAKEIQRKNKEEKENDVGGVRDREEKERRKAETKGRKSEKRRNLIKCGHYRQRRVKWTKRSIPWKWKPTTLTRKIVKHRMKHRSRKKFVVIKGLGKRIDKGLKKKSLVAIKRLRWQRNRKKMFRGRKIQGKRESHRVGWAIAWWERISRRLRGAGFCGNFCFSSCLLSISKGNHPDENVEDVEQKRGRRQLEMMKKRLGQAEWRTTKQRRRRGRVRNPTNIQGRSESKEEVERLQWRRGWTAVRAIWSVTTKETVSLERRECLHDRWGPRSVQQKKKKKKKGKWTNHVPKSEGEGKWKVDPSCNFTNKWKMGTNKSELVGDFRRQVDNGPSPLEKRTFVTDENKDDLE